MIRIRYLVPSLFTSLSLLSALTAIHFILESEYILAPWLIIFSMLCDFLDGKFARLLKAASPFGALYDTLSDFVAFGITPALLIYRLSLQSIPVIGAIVAVMYVFSGCYRLVRFTLRSKDSRIKSSFIGLPIPIAAGFLSSWVIFSLQTWNSIPNNYVLLFFTFILSLLMSSRVEYLIVEHNSRQNKKLKLLFLLLLVTLAITIRVSYLAILFWITAYILYCLIRHLVIVFAGRSVEHKTQR